MRTIFTIKPCSPMATDVSNMIDLLDRYQSELYPAESNHLDARQTLSEANCKFLGAYCDGELVGIGAAKMLSGYSELKRFFVPEKWRGNGIAELLIATLEHWLVENGIDKCFLETGIHQHAALKFYEKLGYELTGPFGSYKQDPLSVFMFKDLSKVEISSKSCMQAFYLVAFSSQLNTVSTNYQSVGREMEKLARQQQGFIGINATRNTDGNGFTASYWKDLESISAWRQHPRHLEAQALGRKEFYSRFRSSLASVERLSP